MMVQARRREFVDRRQDLTVLRRPGRTEDDQPRLRDFGQGADPCLPGHGPGDAVRDQFLLKMTRQRFRPGPCRIKDADVVAIAGGDTILPDNKEDIMNRTIGGVIKI